MGLWGFPRFGLSPHRIGFGISVVVEDIGFNCFSNKFSQRLLGCPKNNTANDVNVQVGR